MKIVIFVGVVASMAMQSTAWTQTRALPPKAKAIVDRMHQGAREDCRDQRGTFRIEGRAVTDADLNGDGRPDYLVDSGAYQCSSASAGSLYCGTLGCAVDAVVSSAGGYREFSFGVTRGFTRMPNKGGDILRVETRPNNCGPRANSCPRYWRLIGSKFEMFTTPVAATAARPTAASPSRTSALPARGPLREGFRAMTLPSGQRVAALNGIGPMRTLSVGCRSGSATMLLATRAPARPAEVVVRTRTRAFTALPSAAPRPDLWEFRLSDPALFNVLTSPDAGFAVTIGGVEAGQYALTNGNVVRAVLAPCATSMTVAVSASAIPPAPASAARVGVMGIPIRRGYYVASHERCERAIYVYRVDANGHAEGSDSHGRLTFIKWKRAVKQRDGSYDVEYAPSPGEMAGDEIVISIKPLNPDTFNLTIQDDVRLRRCDTARIPAWARQ